MPKPSRDSQRARVYDAEHLVRGAFDRADLAKHRTIAVHGSQLTLPIERRFGTIESVQEYCDRVLALNWVSRQWPRSQCPVRVRARAGATAAHYARTDAVLAVPTQGLGWALRELVVLHELAHHLAPDAGRRAPHGPGFCTRFLTLVDGIIGPEAGFLLRTAMHSCRVQLRASG